jgi:outer membrane receptor protein involved in Fe transport
MSVGFFVAPMVCAQSATTATGEGSLQEVLVTATRREESVEKVPISIQAMDQEQLTQYGIKDIADLAAMVPGLQFSTFGGASNYTSVAIRGFNTMVGASTVGIYLDETPLQGRMSPLGSVGFIFPIVFDLDRIEVLRGPQGTLFGASSESGAIRFITNQPSLTQNSGFSHAEYSVTQDGSPSYEVGAAYGGPIINDELGFRVSAWYRGDGGYVNRVNPATDQLISSDANSDSKAVLRAALGLKVADNILITPSVTYQMMDMKDSGFFYDYFSNPSEGAFASGALLPDTSSEHVLIPSLKVEAPLSFATLTFNTSYVERGYFETQDLSALNCVVFGGCGSPIGPGFGNSQSDVSPSYIGQTLQTYTAEVRLASNATDSFASWVAGLYADHRKQRDYQTVDAPTMFPLGPEGNPVFYVNQYIWDNQYAAFAQTDLHVSSQLTVTLGVRQEIAQTKELNFTGAGLFNAGVPGEAQTSERENPFLPKATVSYQLTPSNMVYTSVSKGLRVGGGNSGLPSSCEVAHTPTYDADYLWSYEIGTKGRFFDGRMQVDASMFHIRWSKFQSLVLLDCGLSFTANMGTAVSDGFDLALQALLTDQLRLDLNVGYADVRYVSNAYTPNGLPLALKGDAVQGISVVNPPWDVSVSPNYTFDLPRGDKLQLRAQYIYHSHNNRSLITADPASPSYAPLDVADPTTHVGNLRADYTTGALDFGVYLNNVFNSHPSLAAEQDTPASNLVTNSTFRPRTLGVSANYSF